MDSKKLKGEINCLKPLFKNKDELPMYLSVMDIAKLLGVSRSSAYELTSKEGFPKLRVVSGRIIVPREKLLIWLDEQTNYDKIG